MKLWIDGIQVESTPQQAKLFDPSSGESFGVFETLRTYGGRIFRPDQHLARLEHSAKLLSFTLPLPQEKIAEFLEESVRESLNPAQTMDLRLKCVATAEHILIQIIPLVVDPTIYEGVSAVSFPMNRSEPEAKALPYKASFEAHEFAEKHGAYEAILVDEEGFITEGAYSNIFWVKGGEIYTREEGVLKGITRATILELFPVQFQKITLEELKKADEIFLTKTTTGPVSVVRVDKTTIGSHKPGPQTQKVRASFRELAESA